MLCLFSVGTEIAVSVRNSDISQPVNCILLLTLTGLGIRSDQISCSVMFNSLRPHVSEHSAKIILPNRQKTKLYEPRKGPLTSCVICYSLRNITKTLLLTIFVNKKHMSVTCTTIGKIALLEGLAPDF